MKKFSYIVLMYIFCLFFTQEAFSTDNTLTLIIEKLHSNYDSVTSFKADFKQISFFKSVNVVQEFHGTLYLKKPDKMKWDYNFPEPQLIVSNGEKIWYYYPKDNQVNVGVLSKNNKEKNLIFMLLDGFKKVEQQFNIKLVKGEDNQDFFYLQLIPKKPNTLFEKIILTVAKSNYNIMKSYIFYLSGDIAKLILKRTFKNIEFKDNFFDFKAPAGCEIFKIPSY